MALSTDVTLPKSVSPRFPDRCIVCGSPTPGHAVKISTRSISWWTWAFHWFGKLFSVDVPACRSCGWRLRFRRAGATFLMVAILGAAAYWLGPLIHDAVPSGARKWVMMGALLGSLLPYLAWQVFFPPLIELTAHTDTVDYEFKDADYAAEFQWLNLRESLAAMGVSLDESEDANGD